MRGNVAAGIAVIGLTLHAVAAQGQFFNPRFVYDATFDVAVGASAGRQVMALGDLNGDQRPDLVTIDPAANRIDVFLNQGDGTFVPGTAVSVAAPRAVALADITAPQGAVSDGALDLLIASDSAALTVFRGVGDGTFRPAGDPVTLSDHAAVIGLATGEFDAQAGLDVALATGTAVAVLCNVAGAQEPCGAVSADDIGVEDIIEIAPGDFDADGRADLALLSREAQRIVPLFGNGDATFTVGNRAAVSVEADDGESVDMAVAHLDGDATDDIVVVNRAENFQFLGAQVFGRANRVFRVQGFVADFRASALVVADFDREPEGGLDVIIGYEDRGLTVNVGDSPGVLLDPFTPIGSNRVGSVASLVTADLDGNGLSDLVVLNGSANAVTVLRNFSGPLCPGDCNINGVVTVDELTRGVSIVLGERDARDCQPLDDNQDGAVTVSEIVAAVGALLNGCPLTGS